MSYATAAVLEPVGTGQIALESVDVQAGLRGLYADVTVTQIYRNLENDNIEAVYTFPLPLDAVLLELTLELNDKKLIGQVQPRRDAEEKYEDAIEEGNTAVLLQQVEPGLFTLNVGNIMPYEKAVICFRYGQLHHWQGDSLRFYFPTTIAPRYGEPYQAGLLPHQEPVYVLTESKGLSLTVRIEGELAQADIDCPSHPASITLDGDNRVITLTGGSTYMDRDFILTIRRPSATTEQGLWTRDGEGSVVLASFHPEFPDHIPESKRCISLLVDCSGSMSGDSIAQAKVALHEILSHLNAHDFFNIVIFGSDSRVLFAEPVIANESNIRSASNFVSQVDANMGGTEIANALNMTYASGRVDGKRSDILLITDGEVWESERIIQNAQRSGHRIFSVGVGSAVSEALVQGLASTTAGACELVSPRENMSERIVRHFHRIDQPRAKAVSIEWTTDPDIQIPAHIETVFTGDTLHVFGWFSEQPGDKVKLVMTLEGGQDITQDVMLSGEPLKNEALSTGLPRMAAYARLHTLDDHAARELAVDYQLVTEQTSCMLVYEREADKPGKIPALRKVPHMLAAGWGGTGNVISSAKVMCDSMDYMASESRPKALRMEVSPESFDDFSISEFLNIPALSEDQPTSGFDLLVKNLNTRYPDFKAAELDIQSFSELENLGMDDVIRFLLADLLDGGFPERDVVVCFLVYLLEIDFLKKLDRHVVRLIRKAEKDVTSRDEIRKKINDILDWESA